MKNKKLRLFIIAVIVLQLLVPAGLLWYHNSLHRRAMAESPDFKLRVDYMYIWDYENNSGETLYFDLQNLSYGNRHEDKTVIAGADGVATITTAENKRLNKYWFSLDNYYKIGSIDKSEFSYVDTPEAREVLLRWCDSPYIKEGYVNNDGNLSYDDFGYGYSESLYITAKVYKGLIIPTAVYCGDVRIIDIKIAALGA